MRVITLICESMIAHDMKEIPVLQGFVPFLFDPRPAGYSAQSLWCMQSTEPIPDMTNAHTAKTSIFDEGDFIALHAKTRLIACFWPPRYNPRRLDPLSHFQKGGREPDSIHFGGLMNFLRDEFYSSDYQHLIYWPLIGHAEANGMRVDDEDRGIPPTLHKTAALWVDTIRTRIMPLVKPDTVILMHTDHGTSRAGVADWHSAGFLWAYPSERVRISPFTRLGWMDVRETLRFNFKLPRHEDAKIICG